MIAIGDDKIRQGVTLQTILWEGILYRLITTSNMVALTQFLLTRQMIVTIIKCAS